jgi:ketosteroid isomerase-like protein
MVSMVENTRIASELHAAMNSRDLDKAVGLFADDATWIVMPGKTCYSREEIRIYFEKVMRATEKFTLNDIQPPIASGNTLTHEYTLEIRLRDGREGFVPSIVVIELSNGKITQVRNYIDKLEAAKQLAKGPVAKRAVGAVAEQVEELINP